MRLILISLLFLTVFSCKDFQTESYSASGQDKKAVAALADTIATDFSTRPLSRYNTEWNNDTLALKFDAVFDSLQKDTIELMPTETAYSVGIPSRNDTSYAIFKGATSEITVYVSEAIDIRLVSGADIQVADEDGIEAETAFEALNGNNSSAYYLKTRLRFNSVPQKAVLQFIKTESTKKSPFKMIITQ